MNKQSFITILLIVLMSMTGVKAFAHDIAVSNSDGKTIYYNLSNSEKKELVVTSSSYFYYDEYRYSGNVVIPESVVYEGNTYSVTSIGSSAFNDCSGLTSVTIPNSVISIGEYAFSSCFVLTSIISLNNTPPTCEQNYDGSYNQFNSVDKTNCILWVPRGSVNAYKEADGWKNFQNFKELTFGDVNLDGKVNKDDLNALVDFIMGENPEGFYESLADLNGDDEVNAADVVILVDILNVQEGLSTDRKAHV